MRAGADAGDGKITALNATVERLKATVGKVGDVSTKVVEQIKQLKQDIMVLQTRITTLASDQGKDNSMEIEQSKELLKEKKKEIAGLTAKNTMLNTQNEKLIQSIDAATKSIDNHVDTLVVHQTSLETVATDGNALPDEKKHELEDHTYIVTYNNASKTVDIKNGTISISKADFDPDMKSLTMPQYSINGDKIVGVVTVKEGTNNYLLKSNTMFIYPFTKSSGLDNIVVWKGSNKELSVSLKKVSEVSESSTPSGGSILTEMIDDIIGDL
jgi:cell division protein FtsB